MPEMRPVGMYQCWGCRLASWNWEPEATCRRHWLLRSWLALQSGNRNGQLRLAGLPARSRLRHQLALARHLSRRRASYPPSQPAAALPRPLKAPRTSRNAVAHDTGERGEARPGRLAEASGKRRLSPKPRVRVRVRVPPRSTSHCRKQRSKEATATNKNRPTHPAHLAVAGRSGAREREQAPRAMLRASLARSALDTALPAVSWNQAQLPGA